MFDSLPLMLADATQPAADEVPIKPNAPTLVAPSDQTGATTATQGTAGSTTQPAGAPPPQTGLFGSMPSFVILMAVFVVVWWVMGTSQRKEKKKRASMLSALKKGDKVQTIGGVIASVIEVREHDVVLKVDDNSNTRMRFTRGAIQTVLDDKPVEAEEKV